MADGLHLIFHVMRDTAKNSVGSVRQPAVILGGVLPRGEDALWRLVLLLGCCVAVGCDVLETPSEPQTGSVQSNVVEANGLTMNRLSANGINLNGINLNGINLNGINLNGINLNGINLNGINLNGINLNGINLNGINLNGINLNGINLNGINLNGINLNGINLNGINLNGINLNGINLNGINLNGLRLNGINLNGINLNGIRLNGINLNGIRLNGINLNGINLNGITLEGTAMTEAQVGSFKLALSYVAKCALPQGQCATVTDVDGTSTYSLCGESGLDPDWSTNLAVSVTHEEAVTQCVIDLASNDPAHPDNTITHTNQERLIVKDMFDHVVSCALPAGTCVKALDVDGISTYAACGSQGLDPGWLTGSASTQLSAQVASCVTAQAGAHGDAWFDYRMRFKTVLEYATQCALRADQTVTVTDWTGAPVVWRGALGLADWWAAAPLQPAPAPHPAAAGEELISACLMARTNALGNSVSISLRARPELAAGTAEASAYAHHEGAFMGNLFGATPVARVCAGPQGSNWLVDPITGARMSAGRSCTEGKDCGFEYLGACASVCGVVPGGGESLFDECAGNAHVINTFLYSVKDFAVSADPAALPVSGSELDAPMVAQADFNRDGHTDLAIENNATSVIVRLGNSDGTFGPEVLHDLGASTHVRTVIAKDLDGDGKIDLVTANQDSLSVLRGLGDGSFAPPVKYPVTGAAGSAASVVAADFNRDGKLDLATNLVSGYGVFPGYGNGSFGPQTFVFGPVFHHSMTAGDFNGDGRMDLASAYAYGPSVYVVYGNGNGTFGLPLLVSGGGLGARARSLTAGDFDRDGKTDLAVALSGDNTVRVMLGRANGTFASQTYPIAGDTGDTTFVGAAYLDGDATLDLMVARGSSIAILSGGPGGTFSAAGTFAVGDSTRYVVAGHFDRDPLWRVDLLASSDAGRLALLAGETPPMQ